MSMVILGPLCTWWRGDPLPVLPPFQGFRVEPGRDEWLERIGGYAAEELARRRSEGHRPYVALVGREPVAYGWVATQRAEIGALALAFLVPPGERYLWDFFTLPEWRGRGIYPRLLQAILELENEAERFWIGYDAPNAASARGIAKAGFRVVVKIVRLADGRLALVPVGPAERVAAAARLLGLPIVPTATGGDATSEQR